MIYPSDFLDDIRARVPLSRIIGRAVKLRRAGRELIGLCPFHKEKTPSFAVSDVKGMWHCHGCDAGGDLFGFLRQREGLSFTEAVERLAGEAGLPLPQPDPRQVERETRKLRQIGDNDAMQARFVADRGRAQSYLEARGVGEGMAERFGLGWSSGSPWPNRVTIPIHDLQGRLIGFGARATGADQPKYLNTPETEAFQKGKALYNAHRIRQTVHEGAELAVVEGYFDVIACAAAGICAVATMGTAIGEAQLLALWRLTDTPVLLLDGDAAGRKAALRAITVALPLLEPGRSLRVGLLPPGMDPDSLMRKRGKDAVQGTVGASYGLPDAWWHLGPADASERTLAAAVALTRALVDPLEKVPDPNLRRAWIADVRDRIQEMGRRKPLIRANGVSHHSTNPGSVRLVNPIEVQASFTLKEAALIARVSRDPDMVTEEHFSAKGIGERAQSVIYGLAEEPAAYDSAVEEALGVVRSAGIKSYG